MYKVISFSREQLELAHQHNNDTLEAVAYRSIGIALYYNNQLIESQEYFYKSLKIFLSLNDSLNISLGYNDIGFSYFQNKNYKLAFDNYNNALVFAKKTDSYLAKFLPTLNLGKLSFEQKKYEEALNFFNKALIFTTKIDENDSKERKSIVLLNIGRSLSHLSRNDEALAFFNKTITLAKKEKNYSFLTEAYLWKTNYYETNGDIKTAYKLKDSAYIYRDSLHQITLINKKNNLVEKRILEETELKLEALNKERLAQKSLYKSRLIIVIIIIIFMTILVVALMLHQRKIIHLRTLHNKTLLKKNKKLNKTIKNKILLEEKIQDMQTVLAKDLHDNFGNRLSSIIGVSEILKDIMSKPNINTTNFTKFLNYLDDSSFRLLSDIKDLIWCNDPKNNHVHKIAERFHYIISERSKYDNIEIMLETHFYKEKTFPPLWNRQLLLIFKEAINNASKFANSTKIEVLFTLDEQTKLCLIISDNGRGFNLNQVDKIGLFNIQKRAEYIGLDCHITSAINEGTTITITGSVNGAIKTQKNEA